MMNFPSQKGFALLYTVIIVSLILTISISISNISYKQGILSSLAKDSQIAFYKADAGAECGLYYDVALNLFPLGTPLANAPEELDCNGVVMGLVGDESADDYFFYEEKVPNDNAPCFTIVFDKFTDPAKSTIKSRGHNVCAFGPRQVERAVKVTF